jgi:hypothetical protein
MRMRYVGATSILLTGALFLGCERGYDAEPALTPAARTSPAAERAIEAISAARCDHEQRCNSIGPTAQYMTREHCMNVMRADGYDELGVCRLGIDQQELQSCLTEIADEDCGAPMDRLQRKVACRSGELCLD